MQNKKKPRHTATRRRVLLTCSLFAGNKTKMYRRPSENETMKSCRRLNEHLGGVNATPVCLPVLTRLWVTNEFFIGPSLSHRTRTIVIAVVQDYYTYAFIAATIFVARNKTEISSKVESTIPSYLEFVVLSYGVNIICAFSYYSSKKIDRGQSRQTRASNIQEWGIYNTETDKTNKTSTCNHKR